MAGRRLQDWTNRNLFISSFDSAGSYQNAPATFSRQPKIEEEDGVEMEMDGFQARKESPVDVEATGGSGKPITSLQAAWNVTNAIQGMFIVGLPFAVKVGGWCALLALVGVAWICYRTGLSLIDCLYEEQDGQRKRVRNSYRDVAEAVRPGLGKFVLAAQLTELAST